LEKLSPGRRKPAGFKPEKGFAGRFFVLKLVLLHDL